LAFKRSIEQSHKALASLAVELFVSGAFLVSEILSVDKAFFGYTFPSRLSFVQAGANAHFTKRSSTNKHDQIIDLEQLLILVKVVSRS
jgi:hypothetical protein